MPQRSISQNDIVKLWREAVLSLSNTQQVLFFVQEQDLLFATKVYVFSSLLSYFSPELSLCDFKISDRPHVRSEEQDH